MADTTITVPTGPALTGFDERAQAEALAARYRAEFVDLKNFKIQHDLLRTVPVELMFRYNFVPIEQNEEVLVIAVSDPSRLMVLDGMLVCSAMMRVASCSADISSEKKPTIPPFAVSMWPSARTSPRHARATL